MKPKLSVLGVAGLLAALLMGLGAGRLSSSATKVGGLSFSRPSDNAYRLHAVRFTSETPPLKQLPSAATMPGSRAGAEAGSTPATTTAPPTLPEAGSPSAPEPSTGGAGGGGRGGSGYVVENGSG